MFERPLIGSRILRAANRRLIRPFANELRRGLAFALHVEQTVVADRYGEFRFRVGNRIEVGRTLDYGYEPVPLGAFLFLLRDDDVVWDVGASVGLYTVHSAARCRCVVAFEPDAATFARLGQNVGLNGLTSKVQLHQLALGEAPGELQLATDGLDGMAPTLTTRFERHSRSIAVKVETIDLMIAQGAPHPDVVKIDIEGAEILALRGARGLLNGPRPPRLLFVELHPRFLPAFGGSQGDVMQLLTDAGYQVVSMQERGAQYHVLAMRNDRQVHDDLG